MVEPKPIHVPATTAAAPARAGVPAPAKDLGGARFQALLEELDQRAKEMAKSAQEPLSAESLPAAVESARTSLTDALALSASLLEAWRQSVAQAPGPDGRRP